MSINEGDLKFFMGPNLADIQIDNRDAENDDGLETAVIISLFTNKRVTEDEIPDADSERGGFWGDTLEDESIGSKFWLLRRSKLTDEVITRYRDYGEEALAWMKTSGVAKTITVTVERIDQSTLALTIAIERPIKSSINLRYFFNWENQIIKRGSDA